MARIRGLLLASWCLAAEGKASGDQRRRTGSGSALRRVRDDALYKHAFTLRYFSPTSYYRPLH